MIKSIIVEDDPQHALNLKNLLKECSIDVEVLATCSNIESAYSAIVDLKPTLLFLDIELEHNENGFDLLRKFNKPNLAVIFTTVHNDKNYLLKAIKASALDYLPKPFLLSDLEEALNKIDENSIEQLDTFCENNDSIKEIWISSTDGKTKIEVSNIIYCQSDNSYTTFFLDKPILKKSHILSSKNIGHWENILKESFIIRVHSRYLVNCKFVENYKPKREGDATIIKKDGSPTPVSKSRRKETERVLNLFKSK